MRSRLGQSTAARLVGESEGIVTHQKYVTQNDLARIGFGQSIAVTPIQLASAVCAAINGGGLRLHPAISLNENHIDLRCNGIQGPPLRPPFAGLISAESSAYVRQILQSVVDNGTGGNAQSGKLHRRRKNGNGAEIRRIWPRIPWGDNHLFIHRIRSRRQTPLSLPHPSLMSLV